MFQEQSELLLLLQPPPPLLLQLLPLRADPSLLEDPRSEERLFLYLLEQSEDRWEQLLEEEEEEDPFLEMEVEMEAEDSPLHFLDHAVRGEDLSLDPLAALETLLAPE